MIPLPTTPGGWKVISADPPWHFRARTALQVGNWTSRRDAEKHYKVMGIEDIAALPVQDVISPDAHLFMWVTGPILVEGKHLPIMKAWGFRPSSLMFTWIKLKRRFQTNQLRMISYAEIDLHVGLGLTSRKNAEFVVLGRRGNAKRLAKDVREVIMAPVREHSRKPEEYYPRVERYCVGPRLEMFSRETRAGWTSWGLEAGKFDV